MAKAGLARPRAVVTAATVATSRVSRRRRGPDRVGDMALPFVREGVEFCELTSRLAGFLPDIDGRNYVAIPHGAGSPWWKSPTDNDPRAVDGQGGPEKRRFTLTLVTLWLDTRPQSAFSPARGGRNRAPAPGRPSVDE
ncbi:hypothetical protein Misp04_53840 [Micromonospora sp. NBRC 101691]|nr:hypothetical protein Misp04_53840 [Micromonospora sp. NBRC 101691]